MQYNQQQRKRMIEEKVNNLFRESTEMYCQGSYQACLALLSDCLTLESDRSILYSNRSIAHYHLKQLQNSFEDLELALRANHLNYIAYFNLFSLHFLNGNHPESFKNLCLCLSSAYTILCRCEPRLQWIEQSIYYSFNNKESLFLKAILIYQKSQLRASLQLMKRAEELENNFKNRKGIVKHIHSIQAQLGIPKTHYQMSLTAGSWHTLQTDAPYPEEGEFESQLSKMLKQFNEVYRKINDQMQMEHEMKDDSNSLLSEEEKSEIEQDKDVNRITAYNSTAFSRNVEQQDQKSTMHLSHNKELKLLSMITETVKNDCQPIKSATFLNNGIYPLKKEGQKVKFFIEEAHLNISFDDEKQKNENIYAILSYKQGEDCYQHRTSIIEGIQSNLKWYQWTDDLYLTPQATDLEVKVLNKRYTAFKDDLLAEGQIQVSKKGPMKIPLFHRQECNGMLTISIEIE